jgi:hypothetical protein
MRRSKWMMWAPVAGAILMPAPQLHAKPPQSPPASSCTNFLKVTEWKGTFTLVGTGSGSLPDGGSYSIDEKVTATPDMLSGNIASQFGGALNETIHVDDIETHPDGTFYHVTDDETVLGGAISLKNGLPGAGLAIDPTGCTYEFDWDPSFHATITTNNGTQSGTPSYGFVGGFPSGSLLVTSGAITSPLPTSGLSLSNTASISYFSLVLGDPGTWTLNWALSPALNLDLQVIIPQYSSWRPTGGHTESDTGLDASGRPNLLTIQALLINKTTKQPVDFPPDSITFTLVNPSSEPGVALNSPPRSALMSPIPPDLSFDKNQPLNASFNIDAEGVVAQVNPIIPANLEPVTIVLSPHDWGGWATLNVIATVGGQSIPGHININGQGVTDILLPQRQQNSHIADSWKTAHGIALTTSDLDDSENNPVGDTHTGDGLSLYEEYRGFYMGCSLPNSGPPQPEGAPGAKCQHVEGDPQKKDIFVVELIPADEGILAFQWSSGLTVHFHGLTPDEIGAQDTSNSGSYRLINFNHSQGAHVADQHALVLQWGTQAGVSRVINIASINCPNPPEPHACRPGLPREMDHIGIDTGFRDFGGAQGALALSALDEFVYTVAHELSHAVDVYHHGDVDGNKWWFLDPATDDVNEEDIDVNGNPIGSTKRTIFVMTEDQNPSSGVVALVDPSALKLTGGRAVFVGNNFCGGAFTTNGLHSGDAISFMRYDVAEAYIPAAFPTVRFWVSNDEVTGVDLTDHPVGTGVNNPNRMINGMLRVRYGDADTTDLRGNDRSQVDVNDTSSNSAVLRPLQACP